MNDAKSCQRLVAGDHPDCHGPRIGSPSVAWVSGQRDNRGCSGTAPASDVVTSNQASTVKGVAVTAATGDAAEWHRKTRMPVSPVPVVSARSRPAYAIDQA
jgi:hypothetical protein